MDIIKKILITSISIGMVGCAFPDKDGDYGAYVYNCQKYAYGKAYAFEHRDFAYKVCKDAAKLWVRKTKPAIWRVFYAQISSRLCGRSSEWVIDSTS